MLGFVEVLVFLAGGAVVVATLGSAIRTVVLPRAGSVREDLTSSGSALLTLGFEQPDSLPTTFLAFSEAIIGLTLVALLITYLPSLYSAFSARESEVALLEVRAGAPPSGVAMIERFARINWVGGLSSVWRAGYIALRRIAGFFGTEVNNDPQPDDPISVSRDEFDGAYDRLVAVGLTVKPDREQAWKDFCGWRVNYDHVLLSLASLTMAPYAPWSSDRSSTFRPRVLRGRNYSGR